MIKIRPGNHIFKLAGAVIGAVSGLGIFGLVFGFIGGALIDQLTSGFRQKRRLRTFLTTPWKIRDIYSDHPVFIEAAGLTAAWFFCYGDPAKMEVLSSVALIYLQAVPNSCIEILSDIEQTGQMINTTETSKFFGSRADEKQKKQLLRLLLACGLETAIIRETESDPDGESSIILAALDIGGTLRSETGDPHAVDLAVLGLGPDAKADEIKRIYRKLAAQFHPDSNTELSEKQQEITQKAFIRIKEAYERLSGTEPIERS